MTVVIISIAWRSWKMRYSEGLAWNHMVREALCRIRHDYTVATVLFKCGSKDFAKDPLNLLRLILSLLFRSHWRLFELPWSFTTLADPLYHCTCVHFLASFLFPSLRGLFRFHPLQHLRPLNILHKLFILPRSLANLSAHPACPFGILHRDLFR